MRFSHWLSGLSRKQSLSRRFTRRKRHGDLRPAVERLEDRTLLSTFTVNSTADTVDANPGDGVAEDAGGATTLRAAIMEANSLSGDDTINLPAGVYVLSITGPGENGSATGDLDIASNINLVGDAAATTVIDANEIDRVLDILENATVSISGVTFTDGRAPGPGEPGNGYGGGISTGNGSTVTISESVVSGNNGAFGTGGVAVLGDLTLLSSTVSDNTTAYSGGAVWIWGSSASGTLINTTVSGNSAANGGGVATGHADATLSLQNSTIVNNSAGGRGGGVDDGTNPWSVEMINSISWNNTAVTGPDASGSITSLGHNIIGDDSDSGGWVASDQLNTAPQLGPLGDNGGPTFTHAPLVGSPAIDAGNPATTPAVDQRGATRPQNGQAFAMFLSQPAISSTADTARNVYATDLDGDGDTDVLTAAYVDDAIIWYQNLGASNTFSAHTITTAVDGAQDVFAIDMDDDGDVDVLAAASLDHEIVWYENDGDENFSAHTVATGVGWAASVRAVDMDGDGDVDVLSAAESDNEIAWYENDGGEHFTPRSISTHLRPMPSETPYRFRASIPTRSLKN